MPEHRLSGCAARAGFQLELAHEFIRTVAPCLPRDDASPLRQFLYQSSVVMLQSYLEEYLRCVVAIGTFWKTDTVRLHLGEVTKDRDKFAVMPAPEVGRHAQGRVSFENDAVRLIALLKVLLGASPFPDDESERLLLDFYRVRNLIVHAGGAPTESHATQLQSPGVVVESNRVGDGVFYRLTLSPEFFAACLAAMSRCIATIEHQAAIDATFAL